MGKPVRIKDLASQMIRLAGLREGIDITIAYTGLRPGEKLHEELFHASEALQKTQYPNILLASSRPIDIEELEQKLVELFAASRQGKTNAVLTELKQLVPEFQFEAGLAA
jgi:O-antigen biosynthesis protein WbqV